MMEAAYVKVTCRSMAGQPHRGGHGLVKEQKEASHPKRSMELRLPNSSRASRWEAREERFFRRVPVPGDDSDGMQDGVNPGDEAQTPIRGVQANDARTYLIETHGPFRASGEQTGHHGALAGESRKKRGNPEPRQSRECTR
jgi:hypothetical protein